MAKLYYLISLPNNLNGNTRLYSIFPSVSRRRVRILPIVFFPENVKWAFDIIAFSQISRDFSIEEI